MKKLIIFSSMLMAFSGHVIAQDSTGGLFVEPMVLSVSFPIAI